MILRAIFVDGCFHADPHPGNVLLLPDGDVGLVDFGMVGYLSEARRVEFIDLLFAAVGRNVDECVRILLRWSDGDRETENEFLHRDCTAFIDRYHDVSLADLNVTDLLTDLTALLRENNLFLPGDVALLIKAFITLDGLGRLLDPDFVMLRHVEPLARSAWREQHSPSAVIGRGASEVRAILSALPRDLRELARCARLGQMHVQVGVDQLEQFGHKLDRSTNRLTVGLVTSALIVGTAISLTVDGGPRLAGIPLFGLLGFSSSIAAGIWLLWSILRSRKT